MYTTYNPTVKGQLFKGLINTLGFILLTTAWANHPGYSDDSISITEVPLVALSLVTYGSLVGWYTARTFFVALEGYLAAYHIHKQPKRDTRPMSEQLSDLID